MEGSNYAAVRLAQEFLQRSGVEPSEGPLIRALVYSGNMVPRGLKEKVSIGPRVVSLSDGRLGENSITGGIPTKKKDQFKLGVAIAVIGQPNAFFFTLPLEL